ncbi:MAG TPA: undecaprenyl-diphosphate phosphatase [Candidatus Baltobacteraceae bacterium]
MTFVQATILAILQGVSELFPVSSLGHTILVPALLRWPVAIRTDPTFLAFVVVLHLGTALALLVYYRRDWAAVAAAVWRSIVRGRVGDDRNERVGWLLIVATIPVGILGALLEKPVQAAFGAVAPAAIFLMINGLVMFAGEALRRRQRADMHRSDKSLERLTWMQAVWVGLGESLALAPGISRSGAAMVAGLLCDLDHEDAARYSFMLATPVILAANLLKIPDLLAPSAHAILLESIYGGLVAAVAAYASVAFLTRYFKSNNLRPFGWYCLIFGALCLTLNLAGVIK